MEVFFHNVPKQSTDKTFKNYLTKILERLHIESFRCQKSRGKPFAKVTFLHVSDAARFLELYGQRGYVLNRPGIPRPPSTLNFCNQPIYAKKSDKPPDEFLLRVLQQEKQADVLVSSKKTGHTQEKSNLPVAFESSGVACGTWKYSGTRWVFVSQVAWHEQKSTATFRKRSLIVTIGARYRIDFFYSSIQSITYQRRPPMLTLTLVEAPRMFDKSSVTPANDLAILMAAMRIYNNGPDNSGVKRVRVASLGPEHAEFAGSCFVYRIYLQDAVVISRGLDPDFETRIKAIKKSREVPDVFEQHTSEYTSNSGLLDNIDISCDRFFQLLSAGTLPFQLAFQVQKLVQNGYLSPFQVLSIIPDIHTMAKRSPATICVSVLKKMFNQIPFAEPGSDHEELEVDNLRRLLCEYESQLLRGEDFEDTANNQNVVLVHRARVTPAGIYLSGPELEGNNRILRRYASHHENFLRVQFSDEDGEPIRFSRQVSHEEILHKKFKGVLRDGIEIAGRRFLFLGFSHSSLRAQACWFMAAFKLADGTCVDARSVIQELGDFSMIRSPAKCAARIGQAFSDTSHAIHCPDSALRITLDVERNGRVFSDGVGTMSYSLMNKIWETLKPGRLLQPTCIQIRYQGAKGMISYDSRLQGDVLQLRPSMVKYRGSTSNDIEICGSAQKPLPMKLNRQFIKILEDLGVPESFFLDLQAQEVERLRLITASIHNAAFFLERQAVGSSIQLPWLLKELTYLGLDFRKDPFLRDVLEMAILMELRILKYKSNIPVKQGYHLYGIMDETGILEEGEVFCIVTEDGVPRVITGNDIIITRAPALHPGDVQKANAVTVPQSSPLMQLTNCICFSQKGARDLPSQLSGGDLDGDLYYIMWDPRVRFPRASVPADYPRQDPIDIGRPIETSDMTDFFLKFMETDQLGSIATRHQILADQKPLGTHDPDCITLAGMHSTAVDFSKTGIPVDMKQMPKRNPWRPDFMAPGPHVVVEKIKGTSLGDDEFEFMDNDDYDGGDDEEDTLDYRYYKSHRVLGKLYRAIDERKVFKQIQEERVSTDQGPSFLNVVWLYVQRQCSLIQWEHLVPWARDIREMYEESLLDLMTEYSSHPLRPIKEIEAVVGNILGKNAIPSRRQRDLSVTMKEQYDRNAAFILNCITRDGARSSSEALERSMAALAVSLELKTSPRGTVELQSFKYLAATICLRQVDRFLESQRAMAA
ncbi:RNA-dependent RNA polymerase [Phlyctema vagabunda]|uniref:RNA-dependent RNA polymerase n=1 Tax=Phlyctema vagabunda TaxID=108571 RepID=A0ABR4P724_9HELO